tara:strand:+ start:36 stop:491 length:456 start_codon:yes stop_codon:yes gene_type:complete
MSSYSTEDIKKAINRYLKIREHSRKELQHKLSAKKYNKEDIDSCINLFKKNNLQSDERYAESFIRVKFEAKKGPLLIKNHLSHTGVDKELIDILLSNITEEQWVKNAVSALVKKYSKTIDNKDKMKNFLNSRGFFKNTIDKAIKIFDSHEY